MLLFSKKMYRPTQAMELKFCCLNWKPLFELYKSFKNLLKEDEKNPFPAFLVINERKDFIGNEERIEGYKKKCSYKENREYVGGKNSLVLDLLFSLRD